MPSAWRSAPPPCCARSTSPVTLFGQLAFFIDYVKHAGPFDALVADCPLSLSSPNTPGKHDLLGTVLLSVLAGASALCAHHRAALRSDEPVVAWHAQGCQRGSGAPRLGNDWRGKSAALVAKPSGLSHRTAAERAMVARYGQHREGLMRA
jgi:hypothetical protein